LGYDVYVDDYRVEKGFKNLDLLHNYVFIKLIYTY